MKKLIAVTLVALSLTGCAGTRVGDTINDAINTVQGLTITQNQIDGLRNSYNAAFLAPAASYRQLPRCSTGAKPCRDPNIVRQLQAIDKSILQNFNAVQNLIDTGNNSGLSAAWSLLQEAVSSAKNYAITVGITGA